MATWASFLLLLVLYKLINSNAEGMVHAACFYARAVTSNLNLATFPTFTGHMSALHAHRHHKRRPLHIITSMDQYIHRQHSWRHGTEEHRSELLARARRRAQQGLPPLTYPNPVENKDKIVFLVLFGMPLNLHIKRTPWLIRSVKQLGENVLPWTPIHVVVWYEIPFAANETNLMHDYVDGNIDFLKLSRDEWLEGAQCWPNCMHTA